MASSTFTIKDQFGGNSTYGLDVRLSRNDWPEDKAEDSRPIDEAMHVTFLEVKKVLQSDNGHTIHINYRKGYNQDWKNFESKSIHFADIEDAAAISQPIVINKKDIVVPPSCPDPNNKQAVSDWFFKVANEVGAKTNTPQNREQMKAGFNKCGAKWQVDGSGNTRARFFLAPADTFQYTVDTGDENGPFKLTFRY